MKRHLLAVLLTLTAWCTSVVLKAQNLVINPGFENTSACPGGISDFAVVTNWSNACTLASDTCSTPDEYATCSSQLGGTNVPNALLGYHQPHSGTHFAGIILGDGFPGCVPLNDNYREYIEGQTSSPLVSGQKYLVEFYMSLADASMWGSNSIGIYFTNTQYLHDACPNSQLINVTPQLEMCGPAIMDTVNWVAVQWIYTAAGGEQYLTIGNFKNDANTNRVTHNCQSENPYIYYYIDDVSITSIPQGATNICGVTVLTDSVNTICGGTNGSVTAVALGCTTPFTYHWSNGATTSSLSNVASGSYSVTVSDASNCQTTASTSINSIPLTSTLAAVNPGCGSNTGQASVAVVSGTGPYHYSWSNGATTDTISSLASGSYRVTITGAAGCSAIDSVSLLSSGGLTITPSVSGASCGSSNGSATVVATGGSAPYTYNWSNGQTTQTATGLAAGNYTVTVVGDTINPPLFTDSFTNGGGNWTLNVAGGGSNQADANQWVVNNDANCTCGSGNYLHITCNSSSLACLGQGGTCTYVEFPPNSGFGSYATDVLAESPVISTLGKSNLSLSFSWMCLGTPGTDYGLVDVSADGGTTWTALPTQYSNTSACGQATVAIPINYQNIANFRFAFEWINGAGSITSGQLANPPGFVVDNVALTAAANNCPQVATVTVPATSGLTATITTIPPSCGLKNGVATVTASGTGPFTYAWNNNETTQSIIHLAGGLYVVTVTGAGGCSATASATLSIGSGTISAIANGTNTSCGSNNGSVTLSVSPANGSYTYIWSNGATTSSISNLAAGIYTATITAAGGCTTEVRDTVAATGALTLSATGGTSGCTSTGTASVTATGSGPFTYLWSNGATTASLSSLSAGNYSVTVSEGAGCSASATVTVTNTGSGITLTATPTPTSCSSNNGSVALNITTGTGPYTYVWSNGATTAGISSLAAGSYSVTVTGNNSCSATAATTVSVSGALLINTSAVGTTCGNSNGSASVTATGGPFTYTWSNGATTSTISNLAAGTYTVTVNGQSGCNATQSVVVNPSGSTVTIQASATAICQGDTSHICAPAGFKSYQWSVGDTSQCLSATAAGNYYVTVTDNGNCTAASNHVTITVNTPPTVTITQHGDSLFASGALSYQWYMGNTAVAGATSSVYVPVQDGTYSVKGTDGNGCVANSNSEVVKVLGITQIVAGTNIKVYPNPLSSGGWHIEVGDEWIGSTCDIVDATGRVIYTTRLKAVQTEVELNVAQGVYLMRVHTTGQKNYTIKLIKL